MAALLLALSCNKNRHTPDNGQSTDPQTTETDYTYVNAFGKGVMTTYYLWEKEIAKALTNWTKDVEPIAYVKEIRYKQNGKDFDRWTQMLNDYEEIHRLLGDSQAPDVAAELIIKLLQS